MNGPGRPAADKTGPTVQLGPGAASATVVLSGRLGSAEAGAVRDQLDILIDQGRTRLLVDLADVVFVDSAGLAVLVRARRMVDGEGGEVVLVKPISDDAYRVFRLTQFDRVFRMVSKPGD